MIKKGKKKLTINVTNIEKIFLFVLVLKEK